jgi:two-component system OmpR family response regulator
MADAFPAPARSLELQRILYVEDDPDIREVACMALEVVGGFTVASCASGAEALECVLAFAPQLIVLDVMMPGLDGPGTLAALRAIPGCAAIPVVFVTAKVQPSEIADFLAMGVVDVVAKPFQPMTLADSLRSIWARLSQGRKRA